MPVKKEKISKIVFIVGPTAIGKTRLAVRLAKKINAEVVSADSMQIYKGMRILSQAPSAEEKDHIRHHLIGLLDPKDEYSAAAFIKLATERIRSIIRRRKMPIVAGGSGLYVKALIDGLFPAPAADMKFRLRMHRRALKMGPGSIHKELMLIDPVSAGNIHPNDERRIVRALEIYHITGRTMTDLKSQTKGLKDHYEIYIFGLTGPREDMYNGINMRTDVMFEKGLVREIKRLMKKKMSKTASAALGIKEVRSFLKGEYGLSEAKEMLKQNTRNFAKRQMTWFRADPRIQWFDVSKSNDTDIARKIMAYIKKRSGKNTKYAVRCT